MKYETEHFIDLTINPLHKAPVEPTIFAQDLKCQWVFLLDERRSVMELPSGIPCWALKEAIWHVKKNVASKLN